MMKYNKNQRGQSTVEYILLLAVVMLFVVTIMKSTAFQKFIGKDSPFFLALRNRFIYTYCHSRNGDNIRESCSNLSGYSDPVDHASYSKSGLSRFFSGDGAYPN